MLAMDSIHALHLQVSSRTSYLSLLDKIGPIKIIEEYLIGQPAVGIVDPCRARKNLSTFSVHDAKSNRDLTNTQIASLASGTIVAASNSRSLTTHPFYRLQIFAMEGQSITRFTSYSNNYKSLSVHPLGDIFVLNSVGLTIFRMEGKERCEFKTTKEEILLVDRKWNQIIISSEDLVVYSSDKKVRYSWSPDQYCPESEKEQRTTLYIQHPYQVVKSIKNAALQCFNEVIAVNNEGSKRLRLCNYNGTPLQTIELEEAPKAFSFDLKNRLLVGYAKKVTVLDSEGAVLCTFGEDFFEAITSIICHPSGSIVVADKHDRITIWG